MNKFTHYVVKICPMCQGISKDQTIILCGTCQNTGHQLIGHTTHANCPTDGRKCIKPSCPGMIKSTTKYP